MAFTGLKNLPHVRKIVFGFSVIGGAILLKEFGLWSDALQFARDLAEGAGLIGPSATEGTSQ